jgi:hypothetical protein
MTASTHPFAPEDVMAYLDGELSANRATGVAAHLRECSECAALAEQLRDVSNQLVNWGVEPAPATLAKSLDAVRKDRALSKVEEPKGFAAWLYGKFAPLRQRWALGLAGVALVVLFLAHANLRRPSEVDQLQAVRSQYDELLARKEASNMASSLETSAPPAPPSASTGAAAVSTDGQSATTPVAGLNGRNFTELAQLQNGLAPVQTAPMIARTASVSLIAKDFGSVEASVKAIVLRHGGYIASLNSTAPQDAARTLNAALQIPSAQLESAITELKQLGRVDQESQSGEEVTKEFTDRAARLKNARATEQRLLDLLRDRTGKLSDILAAEQEIARVRGDIEQMEADQRALQTRVDFATVQLSVQEEYKASLQGAPPSTPTRLHNAAVDGYRAAIASVIDLGVWALQSLPTLLLWGLALFFPARWIWKRWRHAPASQT